MFCGSEAATQQQQQARKLLRQLFSDATFDSVRCLESEPPDDSDSTLSELWYTKNRLAQELCELVRAEFDRLVAVNGADTSSTILDDCGLRGIIDLAFSVKDYGLVGDLLGREFMCTAQVEQPLLLLPVFVAPLLRLMKECPRVFQYHSLHQLVNSSLMLCASSWTDQQAQDFVEMLLQSQGNEAETYCAALYNLVLVSPMATQKFVSYCCQKYASLDRMSKFSVLTFLSGIIRTNADEAFRMMDQVPNVILQDLISQIKQQTSDESMITTSIGILSFIASSERCEAVLLLPQQLQQLEQFAGQMSGLNAFDMAKGNLVNLFATILAQLGVDRRLDLQERLMACLDSVIPVNLRMNTLAGMYLAHLYTMVQTRGDFLMPKTLINKIESAAQSMDPQNRSYASGLLQLIKDKKAAASAAVITSNPTIKLKVSHEKYGMQALQLDVSKAPSFDSLVGLVRQVFDASASAGAESEFQALAYIDEDGDQIILRTDTQVKEFFKMAMGNKLSMVRLQAVGTASAVIPVHPGVDEGYSSSTGIKWRKGRLLGKGAFGSVYEAINLDTGGLLAVKLIKLPSVSAGEEEHFLREIRVIQRELTMLKRLDHPNIVKYLGTSREGDDLAVFQEFVPGGSLLQVIKIFGNLTENVVRRYLKQMLLGLDYLHENHVIHRDLKAANILLDHDGSIRLADFGAAKLVSDMLDSREKHSIRGTPLWMSPEAVKQSQFSAASDIWALGCTIIELLTGKPPLWPQFKHLNEYQVLYQLAHLSEPVDLTQFNLSPSLFELLSRCFELDASKRPSCRELLQHPFVSTGQQGLDDTSVSVIALASPNPSDRSNLVSDDAESSLDSTRSAPLSSWGQTIYETFESIREG